VLVVCASLAFAADPDGCAVDGSADVDWRVSVAVGVEWLSAAWAVAVGPALACGSDLAVVEGGHAVAFRRRRRAARRRMSTL
jgi:hypothetical protein